MSRTRNLLFSVVLATTVLGEVALDTVSTVSAQRSTTTSFTAVGYGTGPIDATTGEYHTAGAFVATRFGGGTLTADSDPVAGFTAELISASGDRIFIRNDPTNPGPALPTYCPTTGPLASTPYAGGEFITGGTGRFANARGYITYSGCLAITEDPSMATGHRFTFTFVDRATITY